MKISDYPKCNGERFDKLRRQEFDYWREQMFDMLKMELECNKKGMDEKVVKVIAWNLAFMIVTKNYK